jgi:hypothetical protein
MLTVCVALIQHFSHCNKRKMDPVFDILSWLLIKPLTKRKCGKTKKEFWKRKDSWTPHTKYQLTAIGYKALPAPPPFSFLSEMSSLGKYSVISRVCDVFWLTRLKLYVMITRSCVLIITELMHEICLYAHSSKRKEGCENATCCKFEISG